MNGMDELIAFLRARLDEDVKVARDATFWTGGVPEWTARAEPDWVHIARHDPARVLAEVESKRQIIDEHAIVHRNIGWLADGDEEYGEIPVCGRCVPKHSHYSRRADVPEGWCRTLRLLALPYAGHPEYREEFKP